MAGLLAGLGVAAAGASAGNPGGAPAQAPTPDTVVLLHGLARSPASMRPLEEALRGDGYRVVNLGYPSTSRTPEELVAHLREELQPAVRACCDRGDGRLHFVTHSLGGILVRALLAREPLPALGRVVMLAPPSRGSEIVDALGESPVFRALFGPTGSALGTGGDDLPARLPPPEAPLGVIAGSDSLNPIGSWLIPGPDDGAVAVERTRVRGMADFALVDATHTFIMRDPEAIALVRRFLRTGTFGSGGAEAGDDRNAGASGRSGPPP